MQPFVVLLCAVLTAPLLAQPILVDSLETLLSNTTDPQKRAILYHDLAFAAFDINPAATVTYSYQSEALLRADDLETKAKLYRIRAQATFVLGKSDQGNAILDSITYFLPPSSEQWSAIENLKIEAYYYLSNDLIDKDPEKALLYANRLLDLTASNLYDKRAMIYNLKSVIYNSMNVYDKALLYIDTALQYTMEVDDVDFINVMKIQLYHGEGLCYIGQSNYEKAIIVFDKARVLCDATGNMAFKATILSNMVHVYDYMDDPLSSIRYIKQSIVLAASQVPFDSLGWCAGQLNMGLAYIEWYRKDTTDAYLDTALFCLDQVIPYYQINENYKYLSKCYVEKGYCYSLRGQYSIALQYLQKAETLQEYFFDEKKFHELQQTKGELYRKIGQLEKSKVIYAHLIDSTTYTNFVDQVQSLEGGIETALLLKDFELAYRYMEEKDLLEDSLIALNNENVIRDLEIQYQTKEVQQQNKLLKQEQEFAIVEAAQNRRLFYLTVGIAILLIGLLLLLLQYSNVKSRAQKKELKFQLLRNQMNPHFLFNVLGAIQSFIYANNPIKAGDFLSSFAILVRSILDHSTQEYIPISEEIEWLKHYISLQALRFEDTLTYTLDIDPALEQQAFMIPPMLIQPVIENALEHGFKGIDYQGCLVVKMSLSDKAVEVLIQDNGVGFDPNDSSNKTQAHMSHARRITKERIALLNRKRAKKITFTTTSSPQQGTVVQFYLPFDV